MEVLAFDLGGTKLAAAIFSADGKMAGKRVITLDGRRGEEVAYLIGELINQFISEENYRVGSIGISVPGIINKRSGKVWAPNIKDWDDFPLLQKLQRITELPITIECDRACYILGEHWLGAARNCRDAIYLAVGTGIGAGILADGKILQGANGISGAIGWMALDPQFKEYHNHHGCFEYYASGNGMVRLAEKLLAASPLGMDSTTEFFNSTLAINYSAGNSTELTGKRSRKLTTAILFEAIQDKDPIALEVQRQCITLWGMAVANLVSLFNPEKIIMGGGLFGPAVPLIPDIFREAKRWAQPVSIKNVELIAAELGGLSGLYGAARIALNSLQSEKGGDV